MRYFYWMIFAAFSLAVATPQRAAQDKEPVFLGHGLCQFLLHQYQLPPQSEAKINEIVAQALQQHQSVFGFSAIPNFHVRIRIFGRFEDFQQFTLTNRLVRNLVPQFANLTNLHGYYSQAIREVVTWRQPQPGYLANNILHESSHAIMCAHYRRIPPWLSEGCATYFAFPRFMQDADDVSSLKYRWAKLSLWLREGKLPQLKTFLDLSDREWHQLNLEEAYTVSWSLFQHLMSTPQKKLILRGFMQALQSERGRELHCAALLEEEYPGGLKRLEQDWHQWISQTSPKVLGPAREKASKRYP